MKTTLIILAVVFIAFVYVLVFALCKAASDRKPKQD